MTDDATKPKRPRRSPEEAAEALRAKAAKARARAAKLISQAKALDQKAESRTLSKANTERNAQLFWLGVAALELCRRGESARKTFIKYLRELDVKAGDKKRNDSVIALLEAMRNDQPAPRAAEPEPTAAAK